MLLLLLLDFSRRVIDGVSGSSCACPGQKEIELFILVSYIYIYICVCVCACFARRSTVEIIQFNVEFDLEAVLFENLASVEAASVIVENDFIFTTTDTEELLVQGFESTTSLPPLGNFTVRICRPNRLELGGGLVSGWPPSIHPPAKTDNFCAVCVHVVLVGCIPLLQELFRINFDFTFNIANFLLCFSPPPSTNFATIGFSSIPIVISSSNCIQFPDLPEVNATVDIDFFGTVITTKVAVMMDFLLFFSVNMCNTLCEALKQSNPPSPPQPNSTDTYIFSFS